MLTLVLLASLAQAALPAAASAPAAPVACTASSDDAKAVADTLRGWYAALSSADEAGFRARTAPDYLLFEDGTRMGADELIAVARKHLQEGDKAALTLAAPPRIEVDCNSAHAIFTTHAGPPGPACGDRTGVGLNVLPKLPWRIGRGFRGCRRG